MTITIIQAELEGRLTYGRLWGGGQVYRLNYAIEFEVDAEKHIVHGETRVSKECNTEELQKEAIIAQITEAFQAN